ncbi:MAG: helix-turn-helix transcriptional regulator [Chloroflexota bacterium]
MKSQKQSDIFQAIAAPIRREIIRDLALRGDQSIRTISSSYAISRQAVTRHIQVLETSGVVLISKVGREQVCQLNATALKEVQQWVSFYEQFWDDKLDALSEYLTKSSEEKE